jgi:hypothetical protein
MPKTGEALKSDDAEKWMSAIQEELNSLEQMGRRGQRRSATRREDSAIKIRVESQTTG